MSDPAGIRWPVRAYRQLLKLFPAEFRRTYGDQMLIAFRDRARDLRHQADLIGLAMWYSYALWDLLKSAAREGIETMSNHANSLLRLGLFGGVLFMLALLTRMEFLFLAGFMQTYLSPLTRGTPVGWLPAAFVLSIELLLLVLAVRRSRNWWWIPTIFGGLRVYSLGAMLLLAGYLGAPGFVLESGGLTAIMGLSGMGLILGLTWWAMARSDGSRLAARMDAGRLPQGVD